jgi:hypothetical protein
MFEVKIKNVVTFGKNTAFLIKEISVFHSAHSAVGFSERLNGTEHRILIKELDIFLLRLYN